MTVVVQPTAADVVPENPLLKVVEIEGWVGVFRAGTGELLADAQRSHGHNDDEWIGWAVKAPNHTTRVIETRVLARYLAVEYATDLVGGVR